MEVDNRNNVYVDIDGEKVEFNVAHTSAAPHRLIDRKGLQLLTLKERQLTETLSEGKNLDQELEQILPENSLPTQKELIKDIVEDD